MSSAPRSEHTEPDAERADDGGFAIVFFALTLTVLMAMAGLGLDLWNLWRTSNEVQRAADAGALAGVTFLPADPNQARNTAFDLVEANGFPRANATASPGDTAQKLEVTVTTNVRNTFMGLFGVGSTTITRKAVAEFVGPVPMGSPANFLGNDPELGHFPDHWMNVASVRNQAGNGDRYQAGLCPGNGALGPCPGSGVITNPSYAPDGHFYAVEVAAGSGGPLRIQVFDPAFYEVGDRCEQAGIFNANQGALQATAAADADIPDTWHDDAAARYVAGNSQQWCTGDWQAGAATGANGPITTTYVVREPDVTPLVDTDNPVVSAATCAPQQFVGRSVSWMQNGGNGIQGRLASGSESKVTHAGGFQQTLANSFRRWVTVCEISVPTSGRYLLQVRTNAPLGSPLITSPDTVNTWGHNRYAIRAGIGDPTSASFDDNVKIFANGRLPIYANASGANTEFYLARILPSGADRILNVSLWDISDGGSAGSMQVVPPAEVGGTFSGCTYSTTGGTYTPLGTCGFSFNANALNAQLMRVSIPIPSSYTCDQADPFGCWIKVRAPFSGSVNDTTTWSADVVGDPVRLIE